MSYQWNYGGHRVAPATSPVTTTHAVNIIALCCYLSKGHGPASVTVIPTGVAPATAAPAQALLPPSENSVSWVLDSKQV